LWRRENDVYLCGVGIGFARQRHALRRPASLVTQDCIDLGGYCVAFEGKFLLDLDNEVVAESSGAGEPAVQPTVLSSP
jgi:hypothetical protein